MKRVSGALVPSRCAELKVERGYFFGVRGKIFGVMGVF